MASREAPVPARRPVRTAEARARNPQAPAQAARCIGAAVQLAAVHRTFRHGPALQLRPGGAAAASPERASAPAAPNRTGLPDRLKAGIEALSGISLDGTRVHYNSSKPAQLNALAYAQGSDIHLAPGEERHLPHETWHIVQQAQGRVKPTVQLRGGVPVNDDAGLEREADAMGAKALGLRPAETAPARLQEGARPTANGPGAPIQAMFDNWLYPDRQIGIEITEDTANNNTLETADPTPAFAGLAPVARAALWQPVNLPDNAGAMHGWQVAPQATVNAYFAFRNAKPKWMKWVDVNLTEDHGEYEWILDHPAGPQNMGFYRARLTAINQSRQALRAALTPIGADLVVAMSNNPGPGQAFRIQMGANDAASAQITIESTSAATTKEMLYEGVSHGLNMRTQPNQQVLANATPDIAAAAQASATRVPYPTIDREVLMAYLYGDLIHKMATIQAGAAWQNPMAGNIKNWRNLFPKSKPFQVTLQAFGQQPTQHQLDMLEIALDGARAAIIQDILLLFATKMTTTARMIWQPGHFGAAVPDPGGHIHTAANVPVAPPGGPAALAATLGPFFAHHGLNLDNEYDAVRDAFITSAAAFVPQVARSSDIGWATHGAGTSGFAAEDRGEIQTTFPGLDSVYDRIKELAGRF